MLMRSVKELTDEIKKITYYKLYTEMYKIMYILFIFITFNIYIYIYI